MPPPPSHCVRPLRDARGRPINEPANLRPILKGLAALLGVAEEQLAQQIWANTHRFLGRWLKPANAPAPDPPPPASR